MRPRQCYSVQIWRFYNDKNVMSENTVYCFQLPKMLVFKKIRNFCETINFQFEFDENILVNWMRPRQCYSVQIWRFYNLRQKRYRRKHCLLLSIAYLMLVFRKIRNILWNNKFPLWIWWKHFSNLNAPTSVLISGNLAVLQLKTKTL